MPPEITSSDIPAHFCSILVNRYTWYLDDSAQRAAEALRRRLPDARVVTYGSSMGGFAAINMSGVLDADYILAISAQSTPLPPFADEIRDRRYIGDRQWTDPQHDVLGTGALFDRQGLLFFDPLHQLDALHAARIASLTSTTLVGAPGAGHPVGKFVNMFYPLRGLLTEAATGAPDVMALRKAMAQGAHAGGWTPAKDDAESLDQEANSATRLQGRIAAALADLGTLGAARTQRVAAAEALVLEARAEQGWLGPVDRRRAIRDLCLLFRKVGAVELAASLAAEELPDAIAARFRA